MYLVGLLNNARVMSSLTRTNILRLALVSVFLTVVDTVQSFYLQRVVSVFSEANLVPRLFYSIGYLGYILYAPIEFLAIFATLLVLWFWASYVVWYHKSIVSKKIFRRPQPAMA